MFNFDRTDLQRFAVAAVGALILTGTAVGAAVGPARAVEKAPAQFAHFVAASEARG
ncbi:MAG TPA: hypothetical protein VGD10_11760 [Allosphingosinicella sp.]|uniref:hypothetical protein n=1 Tax=Allosphingosinicella sp. TaxID=2823234 RepID=UPI002ED7DF50